MGTTTPVEIRELNNVLRLRGRRVPAASLHVGEVAINMALREILEMDSQCPISLILACLHIPHSICSIQCRCLLCLRQLHHHGCILDLLYLMLLKRLWLRLCT